MIRKDVTMRLKAGQVPSGTVKVSGAKNSATRLLAASMLSDNRVVLDNFPTELVDANYKMDFIRKSGGEIDVNQRKDVVIVNACNIINVLLEDYNFPIRTTYLLAAGQVKRSGCARIPYPGGCKIGNRGYDLHTMVWESLGAAVIEHEDFIEIKTEKGFISGEITFPVSTVGGTENALLCASTIEGLTKISNAYITPEVEDLIRFLVKLGVRVNVIGNSYIEVYGSKILEGCQHRVMPDRIEALTWLVYGALSGGSILIKDVPFDAMEIPLKHIKNAGIDFYRNSNSIYISSDCIRNGSINPFELATGSHPGIISDMQPFFVLLGLFANGISRIYDYRYPKRTKYCEELNKIFPNRIKWEDGKITTLGKLKDTALCTEVQSTDLRGSMTLILAGLLRRSGRELDVTNAEMALRGYNKLEQKLDALGIVVSIIE